MAWSHMKDMAMSPKEAMENAPAVAMPSDMSKYPWGLSISLNEDSLEKLEVDHIGLAVGDLVDLRAMAKVTSISEHENEGGKCCRVELQITHLATEVEDEEEMPARKAPRIRYKKG